MVVGFDVPEPACPWIPEARDEGKYEELKLPAVAKSEEEKKNIDRIFSVPGYGEKFKVRRREKFDVSGCW
jgi:hypothetical protein